MLKIGITGGIGSGKTYVCQILGRLGVPVYNCDAEAKRLMTESSFIRHHLVELLGGSVYCSDGSLNKPMLAQYIFSDPSHAARINSLVHPVVKDDFLDFVSSLGQVRFCAMESAILFESGFNELVDVTVVVDAPLHVRMERAMIRDAATEEQVRARMKSQLSDDERRELSDYCIWNDGTTDVESQVSHLLCKL